MKIQAAVLEEFGKPLVVQEVDVVEPGPGEALVRLVACGICHTGAFTASGIDVDSVPSHRLTLDQVNHGFELMEAQDGIRSVIQFS